MATLASPAPAGVSRQTPWRWFGNLLLKELAPFPGRGWTVARITIAATIVMLCIMVFRMPNAALGAYYTLLFSRDNTRATITSVVRALSAVGVSLLYISLTVRIFAGEPFLHFMWVAGTLFITFFLISALSEYLAGTAFGFLAVTSISAWDFPANTDVLFANTLWAALAVVLGALTTTVVEVTARSLHPSDEFTDQLVDRLQVVENALRRLAEGKLLEEKLRQNLEQYALTGTAALRQQVARLMAGAENIAEMSATVALTGRLVDLTASIASHASIISEGDELGLRQAADHLKQIRTALKAKDYQTIAAMDTHCDRGVEGSLLWDIQNTVARFPEVFSGLTLLAEYMPSALDFNRPKRLFKDDAFTNVQHLQFALKGTLAALSCYLIYNSIEWRGLSSSIATCMITALSSVGSSRQKQMLRVAGAILGGIVLGMMAQVFLLPFMDGIGAFTLLFAAVTAISAWIGTSSPRISYAGVQTAFAFYVTHLRVFGPQLSLTVARDDVMGILFGLMMMWVTFDQIWAKDTLADMWDAFVSNTRRIACFDEIGPSDLRSAIDRARVERGAINNNFDQIRNVSDALIFEFGRGWQQKIQARNQVRRWQPELRAYFILQVALLHYRLQSDNRTLPGGADVNVRRSEKLLSLLADLQDRRRQGETHEIHKQIDEQVREFDDERAREGERHVEPSHPERLAHSMLEVAATLAKEMRAPVTQPVS
jgi:multidrug resistance protein MdtO